MSTMKNYLVILLILKSQICISQIEFSPIYGKFDISSQKFKIVEVIDSRTFKDLGILLIGNKDEVRLELKEDLKVFLPKFLDFCSIIKSNKPNELILKVNEFQFGTRIVKKKTWAWFYADLEFYQKNGLLYEKIFEVNKCVEGEGNLEIEQLFGKTHFYFWEDVLKEINRQKSKKKEEQTLIKYEQVLLPKQLPSILTDSLFTNGLYGSFNLFTRNLTINKDLEIRKRDDDLVLFLKNPSGQFERTTVRDSYWGIYDKNVIYKAVRKTEYAADILIPMMRFGNTFELVEGISDSKVNMAANKRIVRNQIGSISNMANYYANLRPFNLPSELNLGIALVQFFIANSLNNPNQRVMLNMKNGELQPVKIYIFDE